jgi:hypothetical protein
LLEEVEAALAVSPPDYGVLSRCMAALQKLPDRDTAPDLLAAQAGIELARGRPERAEALFADVFQRPGASPAARRLGARIRLARHATGTLEPAVAAAVLQQVEGYAEEAYQDSRSPDDLLRCWLAALRGGADDRAAAIAARLVAAHAESREARFVQFWTTFQPTAGVQPIDALLSLFDAPPIDAEALRVFALLQAGDVGPATMAAEAALQQAPGVPAIRWAAAIVFHARALGQVDGSEERTRWLRRRDEQLAWTEQVVGLSDERRAQCTVLRAQR